MECMEVGNRSEAVAETNRVDVQKQYYKETFRYIDEALKLEDKGKQDEAILCYKTSLRSISNGLKISVKSSEVSPTEFKSYKSVKEKLEKARQEVLHRLGVLNVPVNNSNMTELHNLAVESNEDDGVEMTESKLEVELRKEKEENEVLHPSQVTTSREDNMDQFNSASFSESEESNRSWHDTKELISIEEGVRLFYVNGRDVSTWASQCALQIFQILKENIDNNSPPAFLKCGEWLFPMEPGQSPVLKTAHRTYMFPDMADNITEFTDPATLPATLPCVGIILSDLVPETLVNRLERVLSLYCDFRKEPPKIETEQPKRPPPPSSKVKDKVPSNKTRSGALVSPMEEIVAEPGVVEAPSKGDEGRRISSALTKGIHIGSEWISWGFLKGSEIASSMVEKGSRSMQKRIQPNPESATVSPEVSRNIRQLHQTTGSVVQISSFLAATLGSLIINLGKNLAPIVVQHGQKLLPDKYRVENNDKTQHVIDNAKKVAVAGLQGFGLVFLALEQSGKNLYQSIHKAAVETMQHKYGDQVGEVTNDAMGAAGNTAQVLWNVRKLGPKAIAKRTAKETGKAIVEFDEQDNPHVSYQKNGTG